MVSKKKSRALILGAVILGGMASWTAYTSLSVDKNVRRSLTSSPDSQSAEQRSGSRSDRVADTSAANSESTSAARATNAARATTTSAPQATQSADTNRIEAYTEPYRDISIAASEMGTLSGVSVKEGHIVNAGDVIAVMADDVLKASLNVARRSMNVEGTLQSAAADVKLRRTELAKLRQLRERDHASQQEVDRVETELTVAEARHLSVREELEIKQLEFRRIEAQLDQRSIRAPIAGIVSEVHKDAGEFVSPSDPVVARIVQLDPMLIVFSVPLDHRHAFQQDQAVTLQLGYASVTAQGIVEYVSPTTDSSNSSIRVKVRLPNPDGEYQSGERAVLNCETLKSPVKPASSSAETPSPVADRKHENSSRQ